MVALKSKVKRFRFTLAREGRIQNRGPEMANPQWVKGCSGNPGGRPKAIKEVVELARKETPEAIKTLRAIMVKKDAPEAARIAAANSLLDRAWGKPSQPIEGSMALELGLTAGAILDKLLPELAATGTPEEDQEP
jgi:hypothetical protein